MGKEVAEKIIKPPVPTGISGKIFKPSRAFLHKLWFQSTFLATMICLLTIIFFVGGTYLVASADPLTHPNPNQTINTWIGPLSLWTIIANLIWFIPTIVLIPFYFRSIEYAVKAESGDTMPEIYSKKGIVTITRKHLPFRTITNISSKTGPFDRLFKIGSVHIETAGYSGSKQAGPEEKLQGILFYEEVRDFILNELRKFRDPYVTGTEVVFPTEEPVPKMEGLDDEILITLREIRDLLKTPKKAS
jgi:membrane protein YdbS with pleckstrin-like domain